MPTINEKYPQALSEGTVLSGQYIIEKVLGQGGFGITYKALDHKTNTEVAVKEFFPDTLAYREVTTVISYPGERTESFVYGKDSFLQEAQTLAQFIGNANIVRVHTYFEENGTAYFVMDYIDGTSFDDYLKAKGGRIIVEEAKNILIPVMDALGAVHSKGIVHRDVTPDNIYITHDGRIMLLDFGAARYSLGDKSRSLDVILKHGFAPKEQYTRRGKQGPFTDVYSLGATFYFAITGKRPPDSVERLDEDDLIPPHNLGVSITEYQEEAILRALSVQPADRFQTMAEFKNVLLNETAVLPQVPSYSAVQMPQQTISSAVYPQQGNNSADASVDELKNALRNTGTATKKALSSAAVSVKQKMSDAQQKVAAAYQQGIAEHQRKTEEKRQSDNLQPTSISPQSVITPTQQNIVPPQNTIMPTQSDNSEIKDTSDVQDFKTDVQQDNFPAAQTIPKRKNMNLIIGVAAVCIICGISAAVVSFNAFAGNKAVPDSSSSYDEKIDDTTPHDLTSSYSSYVSVPEDKSVSSTYSSESSSSSSAVSSTSSSTSSVTKAAAYTSDDLKIIGNSTENIKNHGCYFSGNGNSFCVTDNMHSLKGKLKGESEYKTYFTGDNDTYSCLSMYDNVLYFVCNKQAYTYKFSTDSSAYLIPELKKYSNIVSLYVTSGCYFVYTESKSLYRVSRKTGAEEESIHIDNPYDFTFYDGWLYYIQKNSDGSFIRTAAMDDFSKQGRSMRATSEYFSDLSIMDGYLYVFFNYYDGAAELRKLKPDLSSGFPEKSWNISQALNADGQNENNYLYGLNVVGDNIFFCVYNGKMDSHHLFHLVAEKDGTTARKVYNNQALYPSTSTSKDNYYRVDFLSFDNDSGTWILKYMKYDYKTGEALSN